MNEATSIETQALLPEALLRRFDAPGPRYTSYPTADRFSRDFGAAECGLALTPAAELSIEVDPRTVTAARLAHLRTLGFNRISFGVQGFDAQVQQAVHRVQPFDTVRELGVADDLPPPGQRVAMLGGAIAGFLGRGYGYIGMDHFALPDDALALARSQGRSQRNFQGYSTQPDGDLVGLGVSAIGRIGASYHQSVKTLPEYYEALRHGQLPVERAIALMADDLARRSEHAVNLREDFAAELAALAPLVEAGLVQVEPGAIQVTAAGWYVVRAVAMVFDRYLHRGATRERFSRMV